MDVGGCHVQNMDGLFCVQSESTLYGICLKYSLEWYCVCEICHHPLLQSVWYAQLGSDILPVVHMPETSHYQVTLSGPHDKFPAGKYTFNFFGESVIGEVRKVCDSCPNVARLWHSEHIVYNTYSYFLHVCEHEQFATVNPLPRVCMPPILVGSKGLRGGSLEACIHCGAAALCK